MKKQKGIITSTNLKISNASISTIKNILQTNFKHKNFFFYSVKRGNLELKNNEENKNTAFINNLIIKEIDFNNESIKSISITNHQNKKQERILIFIFTISKKEKLIIHSSSQDNYNKKGEIINNFNFISEIKNILKLERKSKKCKKTEKKLIKKLRKNNKQNTEDLKTIFLANLSHEIKTPMNSIIGFTDLLQIPGLQSEKVVKFANIANNNAKRLLSLLENIIDLSKIETNNIKLKNKEITVTNLLNEVYILNNNKLLKDKSKNINFSLSTPKTIENVKITADEIRIKQVISILLSNAINFTKEGSIILGAKLNNNKIQFYVKDTGQGIKEENRENIFKSFRQGGNFLKRNNEGSGLGLAIAKGLLDLYQSKLLYKSQEKIGSIFYFSLPILETDNLPEQEIIIS